MPVRTADSVGRAMAYARGVVDGTISANRFVRLACQRQLDDLERFTGPGSVFYFDADAAERVCFIIQHFPHIKGIWARTRQRIELEDWQCFIVATVFGWKYTATDTRRFRVSYVEVPRKNAKSTLTAAVGLYLMACDDEPGAHVVSAAAAREQAKIVFADAQHMARREQGFRDKFGVEVLAHVIVQPGTASKFEALSAEYSNLDGLNLHGALIDELHAHPNRMLWDVLETATGSRAQPLIWAVTTAGVNRHSVCYDQRNHLIDILQGTVEDDVYFGMIYTPDDGDDPWAEETWIKVNPNYGISIYPESLRTEAKRAMVMPSMQPGFLTKHLDVWVNAATAWLPSGAWEKCADSVLDIEDFRRESCYVGIDLALRSDIAAIVIAFPPTPLRDWWAVFGRFYLPLDTVTRPDNAHYQGWETAGHLIATEGVVTDFHQILADLVEIGRDHDVVEIAYDPFDAGPLVNDMEREDIKPCVEVRQTAPNMSPAMVELEGLVLSQKIRHTGDPVLAWMFGNVKVKRQGDLMKPVKDSDEKKIDGVVALLMCIHRQMKQAMGSNGPGAWLIDLNEGEDRAL